MGRTEELSDFQHGTVIGCHLFNKSVREIPALLVLPRSWTCASGKTVVMENSQGPSRAREAQECPAGASPYCCSACDGGDAHGRGHALRGRTKARSMSASSDYRRNQSLHGPSPVTTFGPKACMLQNPKTVMHIQDPASQRLTWNKPPKSVLVIKKIRDASLLQPFKELCRFLTEVKGMIVYVEQKVLEDPAIVADESFVAVKKTFCTFEEDFDDISDQVDFIICLGGDGTLLYASSLFQESVPPVMAFHLGSLGFLTPFKFDTYQSQVTQVIEGNAAIVLRSRLKVRVVKECRERKSGVDEQGVILTNGEADTGRTTMQYQVLNEVVVDRGPSSYLSNVDLFLDGHLITTVQGDGVIVSTPTGSTAYAVAAGASMIHPNVPAIMITPICPHSLSFRPIVVPAGVELKIMLSCGARNTAWVSFDGRKRQEVCHGDSITITTSCFPVPSICFRDPVNDWFESLAQCLHWNVRKKQHYLGSEEEEEY
ncbi:LOW QUALITY PROTEIN: NAD kinase [Anguilla anguilla]|uniref:LOW QUALITY PROTEIN: NAD kinase n=1 Tax=Anguilla anguilla TaxID=7936 RepID=UPI0015B0E25A|nr:LOW QUALITY PROTEIN: NAD kinase [Anguilla anguilla]